MSYTASKLVSIARAEIGYLEKKTNANLDSKTGNAGYSNYTKYARDLHNAGYYQANKNGYEWCEVFNDWCHWIASGKDSKLAQEHIFQTGLYGAGCVWSAKCYRNAGRWFTTPKVGDQAYFGNKVGDEYHTGIVSKVTATKVYIIEGNTSGASGVVSNGGGVFEKEYSLSYAKIVGYGRPRYEEETVAETPKEEYTLVQFIKDVQKACGASVDGIAGPETLSKTVTISATKNRKHAAVKAVQKRLYELGYHVVGAADGIAGAKFTAAVTAFQNDNGCWADGEITAKNKTWKKLLGMK